MVSLRKEFGVCFFIFSLVLVGLLMPSELQASIPCCKNGKLSSCPDLPNGQQYDISKCTSVNPVNPVVPVNPDIPAIGGGEAVECLSGQVQYKASGSCGTSSRKCCSGLKWSDWDKECPENSCSSNQCWNGSKCVSKPNCQAGYYSNGTSCSMDYAGRDMYKGENCPYRYSDFSCQKGTGWTGTGKYYVSYNTITGTLTSGSTGTNCQYSTRSSYSGGERNADKLCATQRKAATGADTSVYDGSCDVGGNGSGIYILECETVVHCK